MLGGLHFGIFASDFASPVLRKASMGLRQFTAGSVKASSALFGAFGTMIAGTVALSAGMTGLGVAFKSAQAAAGFEFAMERVGIVTRATGKEFDALKDRARELGLETEFTATQVAEAMQILAQAGFKTNEVTGDLTSVVLDLTSAAGGMITTAQAAATVSVAWKTFRGDLKSSRQAADQMTRATQTSRLQFADLERGLAGISGEARIFNQNFQETLALMAAARDVGFNAAAGSNAIRIAMRNMVGNEKRLREVTGGQVSAYDQNQEVRSFIDVIDDLEKHWKATGATGKKVNEDILQVFTKRGLRGIGIILKDSILGPNDELLEGVDAARYRLTLLEDSEGAVASAATRMRETVIGTLIRIKGSIGTMAIIVGSVILPILSIFLDKVFDITLGMNRFLSKNKGWLKLGVVITLVASAILVLVGAILLLFGGLALVSFMMKMMGIELIGMTFAGALATMATDGLALSVGLLNGALAISWALLWPVTLLVLGLITAFVAVALPLAVFRKGVKENTVLLKGLGIAIAGLLAIGLGPIALLAALIALPIAAFIALGAFMVAVIKRTKEWSQASGDLGKRLQESFGPMKTFFEALWMLMTNNFRLTEEMFDEVSGAGLINALATIGSLLRWVERGVKVIGLAVLFLLDLFVSIGAVVMMALVGPLGEALYFLLLMFSAFIKYLTGDISFGVFWDAMKEGISEVASHLLDALKWVWSKIFEIEAAQWWGLAKFLGKVLGFAIVAAVVLGMMAALAFIGAFTVMLIGILIVAIASAIMIPLLMAGFVIAAILATVAAAIWLFVEAINGLADIMTRIFEGPDDQPTEQQIEERKSFLINQKRAKAGMETIEPEDSFKNNIDVLDSKFGKKDPGVIVKVQIGDKAITDAVTTVQSDEGEMWGHSPTPLRRGVVTET